LVCVIIEAKPDTVGDRILRHRGRGLAELPGTHIPINHSDERKKASSTTQKYHPFKWTSSMGTSEKRPELAMGRRPIAISEENALVPIEGVRFQF
jgi:hypothetical protein